MMRGTTLILAGAVLCANFAFADGGKSAQVEAIDARSAQMIMPQRMMKVRWENGRIIPMSDWVELGDFAPAGPCDTSGATEQLVFDHFSVNVNTGDIDTSRQVCIPGRFFILVDSQDNTRIYHNPFYANDIESLADPAFNGGTIRSLTHLWYWSPNRTRPPSGAQKCFVAIFCTEEFDTECQTSHLDTVLPGVVLEYQDNLPGGFYYSPVCLDPIGGIPLPATVADDGDTGQSVLGGYIVIYGKAFDPSSGEITLADGAQPGLWHPRLTNPRFGDSTNVQFDDSSPTDGTHDPATECFDYTFNLGNTGCPSPSLLGGAIAFFADRGCQPSNGDVDGNGCVDDADLLAVLFAFGNTGSGLPEDTNCDQVVDDADLLEVLFNFGSGC